MDLTESGVTVDVDEFGTERQHGHPRTRIHQHLGPSDRRQQPDLCRADHRALFDNDITGLHVRTSTVDELSGGHRT